MTICRQVLGTQPHNTQPGVIVLRLDCGHYVCQIAKDKPPLYADCPSCRAQEAGREAVRA
jgi:hypothetical protein